MWPIRSGEIKPLSLQSIAREQVDHVFVSQCRLGRQLRNYDLALTEMLTPDHIFLVRSNSEAGENILKKRLIVRLPLKRSGPDRKLLRRRPQIWGVRCQIQILPGFCPKTFSIRIGIQLRLGVFHAPIAQWSVRRVFGRQWKMLVI